MLDPIIIAAKAPPAPSSPNNRFACLGSNTCDAINQNCVIIIASITSFHTYRNGITHPSRCFWIAKRVAIKIIPVPVTIVLRSLFFDNRL